MGFRPSKEWHVAVCTCVFELCVFTEESVVYVGQRGKEFKLLGLLV